MFQRFCAFSFLLILSLLVISACTGDSDKDLAIFTDNYDLTLKTLTVVEGGTMYFNGEEVEEFDGQQIGTYDIILDDNDLTEVVIQAETSDDEASIELIELQKGENGASRFSFPNEDGILSIQVDAGANISRLRVNSPDGIAENDYVISIYRLKTTGDLGPIDFSVPNGTTSNIEVDPPREDGIFEYDVEIDPEFCGVELMATGRETGTTISMNGNEAVQTNTTFFNFSDNNLVNVWECSSTGETTETRSQSEEDALACPDDEEGNTQTPTLTRRYNDIRVEVTAFAESGGDSVSYFFNLQRERTEESETADARLSNIEVTGGRIEQPFRCDQGAIFALSNDINPAEITVTAGYSEARMSISAVELDDNDQPIVINNSGGAWQTDPETQQLINHGEPLSDSILSDLNEGNNYFVIAVVPEDQTQLTDQTYNIIIRRLGTNSVYVDSAESLQAALINAEPNDEIFIAPGTYVGLASVEGGSGHEQAHFFSAVDGTEESPIRLTGQGAATLSGNDLNQNTIFRLEGSHWILNSLTISGAQNGIVFSGASDNTLNNLRFENIGERGVVIENSSRIQLRGNNFVETGLQTQNREGIDEAYGEAIVISSGEDNIIHANRFGKDIANEAIDIKPDATNTRVRHNAFNTDNTLIRPFVFNPRYLIRAEGSGTAIEYNYFLHNQISFGSDNINAMIYANTEEPDLFEIEIFQNVFDLEDQNIPLVDSYGLGDVKVADNKREDTTAPLYQGTVNETFTTPSYQIRSHSEPELCLAARTLDFSQEPTDGICASSWNNSRSIVALDECADEEAQYWQFEHDTENRIMIRQASDPSNKFYFDSRASNLLALRTDSGANLDAAYTLRWIILADREEINFLNVSSGSSFISHLGDPSESDSDDINLGFTSTTEFRPACVSTGLFNPNSTFTLLRRGM